MAHKRISFIVSTALLCVLPGLLFADDAVRQMNVRQGPESVFDQPVASIIPELQGAKPTEKNGRVGNEFVFWGYKLANGAPADFYACAAVPGVDCVERREKICTTSTKVLSENASMGNVQKLSCRVMCVAAQPGTQPCCTGGDSVADLQVGLVSCE
jgi:hypothetical protein